MIVLSNIIVDGLIYGILLFMIAVGLSITMGLMRFVNLAHGVFAMLGGYVAITLISSVGMPWVVGVMLAVVVVSLVSIPLERFLISRVYGRTALDQVLLTIGVTFIAIALASLIFGTRMSAMPLPALLSGSMDVGFRTMPAQRILVLISGILVFLSLWLVIEKTTFGIRLRAAVDHPATASAVGINTRLVATVAFALGAGMAALGGIVGSSLLPIEPYYPLKYMVLFLSVVAVGGLGSLVGTLASALTLGMVDTATKYLAPEYSSILFFIAIIIIISMRPNGMFGRGVNV
ncbi:branched-chain amino acid ABC transporter permease [Chromohalobacter nigrandesensis]|uniref:branched-chain amino acid ABC transporter permease n=1 Tax=Chromohalobacter nigrandesensis TaxID=119863 RepID=UPI001FF477F7|nr:branched-chain amino acid ABC transporter permease [Chromohalobacter nigrandesensis]MCK0745200.1 branched-chain amino acid ABC transporter permease [Chromohalobacter nigrandesensis]